jgi:predicted Zn-dependent protease
MIRTRQSGMGMRLIIGLIIAAFAIISYLSSQQHNDITGEDQYLSLTAEQEIALGLQSAPEMIAEFGGESPDSQAQQLVDQVGQAIVNNTVARSTPWQFDFHVLDDPNTVNAFALPGGQVFITDALLSRLQTEDQLAGVLSHEVTHVLARHSAQQIAKSDLTNGLVGAVGVAAGTADAAQTAAMIGQLVNMKYGRDDETQSDEIGVCLMTAAGYDPQGMVEVMQILQQASGGGSQPEFLSTHPNPENRIARIQDAIANPQRDCSQ